MPKAFLQTRSTGVYARFLVPRSLQAQWGRQYVVLALRERGDAARLSAAQLGYALGKAFDAQRRGEPVTPDEVEKLLEQLRGGRPSELTLKGVRLPNGVAFEHVQIDTPADLAFFRQTLIDVGATATARLSAHLCQSCRALRTLGCATGPVDRPQRRRVADLSQQLLERLMLQVSLPKLFIPQAFLDQRQRTSIACASFVRVDPHASAQSAN